MLGIFEALGSTWTMLTVGALLLLYFVWRKMNVSFAYFDERGVATVKPWPIFGNFGRALFHMETLLDMMQNAYIAFPDKKFYGSYEFARPVYNIRDPELIRMITIKDFDSFADHRPFLVDIDNEPLFGKSLFMLRGQKWRDMRATLSPAFTGSKMRQMFELVVDCAQDATARLLIDAKATGDRPYVPEMKDLFTRFTNDMIATSAFGIKVNSLENRENEFYMTGKKMTNFGSFKMAVKMAVLNLLPRLSAVLGISLFGNDVRQFYHRLVHDTIAHREREGIIRPDMINLLMEARKGALEGQAAKAETTKSTSDDAGFATVEEVSDDALKGTRKQSWDDDDVTAQCFLFFFAGFETSATLLCFAAHELMENADVQKRLIEELDEAKRDLGGKPLTYDTLQKLRYLDMVVSETLRKWPPAIGTDRECQRTYRMTDNDGHVVTLQKGDSVAIPAYAIHHDAQYFEDPERFDPERFSDERKGNIKPFTYLPFGLGPRNCIGSRFALMEVKAILYYLLSSFTFEVAETSCVPLRLMGGFMLKPKNGFNIQLKPRI